MSHGVETVDIVDPWLYATLAGDSTLVGLVGGTIINAATDEVGLAPPYVVFNLSSERDILGVGTTRIQVDCVYLVKGVVAGGNYDPVKPIFRRVDALLNIASTVSTDDGDITCVRESIVQYPEVVDGRSYRHLGGLYRIRANAVGDTPGGSAPMGFAGLGFASMVAPAEDSGTMITGESVSSSSTTAHRKSRAAMASMAAMRRREKA